MSMTHDELKLVQVAIEARANAYAPYSRFLVGAAVRLRDGRISAGVNVENVSFGLTICAERNAVAAAVLAGAKVDSIVQVAVVAEADTPVSPCGACRQVLGELASADTEVLLHNVRDGSTVRHRLGDLLPHAFAKEHLSSP